MNKHRHTNTLYSYVQEGSGVYLDDTNQMVLFDNNDLPLLVKPNTRLHNHDRQVKREVVRRYITKRYSI